MDRFVNVENVKETSTRRSIGAWSIGAYVHDYFPASKHSRIYKKEAFHVSFIKNIAADVYLLYIYVFVYVREDVK